MANLSEQRRRVPAELQHCRPGLARDPRLEIAAYAKAGGGAAPMEVAEIEPGGETAGLPRQHSRRASTRRSRSDESGDPRYDRPCISTPVRPGHRRMAGGAATR